MARGGAMHGGPGGSGDGPDVADDQLLARALPFIEHRLRARHPHAPPELIRRSVLDATARCDGARVTAFLPILVERWASEEVRRRLVPPSSD